jgi:hypothetical protein
VFPGTTEKAAGLCSDFRSAFVNVKTIFARIGFDSLAWTPPMPQGPAVAEPVRRWGVIVAAGAVGFAIGIAGFAGLGLGGIFGY